MKSSLKKAVPIMLAILILVSIFWVDAVIKEIISEQLLSPLLLARAELRVLGLFIFNKHYDRFWA